jgi:hypothetical protein
MSNYVTIQVQIDDPVKAPVFTETDLITIQGHMSEMCSKLERFGYVRAQLYLNDKAINL